MNMNNNSITTYRMEKDDDDHFVFSETPTLNGAACYIEKLRSDAAPYLTVAAGVSLFLCVLDFIANIQVGDRVIDKNGIQYTVKELQKFDNNTDVPPQTELIMTVGWTHSL